jgi:hypothetical protein
LLAWAQGTPYFTSTFDKHFAGATFDEAAGQLIDALVRSGAARVQDAWVINT